MIKHCTTILLFIFLLQGACLVKAQTQTKSKDLKAGYYLTIAAYAKSKEHYAKAYTEKVRGMGHEASYDFFPKKNYYFVYLKYYNDFNTSIRDLYQTRKNTEFDDCWVYVMRQTEVVEKARNKQVSSLDDMFAKRFGDDTKDNEKDGEDTTSEEKVENSSQSAEAEQVQLSDDDKSISQQPSETSLKPTTKKIVGKNVFMSMFYGTSGKEVKGQVQIIDASNNKLLKKYDANKVIALEDPKNGNGNLILISDVFGYKKVQHDFNYENPLDEEEYPYVTNIEDTIIVNFELARYTKGDIVTMYNVFFYKDAAIMRPESKFEINELVAMLKENPKMKIKIHGHTNGNAHGKIITMNNGSKSYFSLSADNKTTFGSSKKLSHERASIMKKYLVGKGINPKHIETKAWGGKSKIHHKLSSQAHKNVRVEIEVLED